MSQKSNNSTVSHGQVGPNLPKRPTTSVIRDACYKWTMLAYPEINFTWVIENFSIWIANIKRRKVKIAYSPEFPTEPSASKWKLAFQIDNLNTALYLKPVECPENIKVNFFLTVYGNHRVLVTRGFDLEFTPDAEEFQGCKYLLNVHRLVQEAKIRGNKLVISCELLIQKILNEKSTPGDIQQIHVANAKLHSDMGKLLDMDQFGDVELVVGDRKFTAYKGILAARSTVFADMFQGQLKRFVLGGIEPDLFQEVLRYIYTDQVSDLGALKFQLFAAAHRYNIGSLKQLCRDAIVASLSQETVVQALKTAEVYEAHEMKHKTLAFICTESIELTQVPGWIELVVSHPDLAREARYNF